MNSEDTYSEALETGDSSGMNEAERVRVDSLRDALGTDVTWEAPPPDLEQRIVDQIGAVRPGWSRGWTWVAAAVFVLVAGTVAVISLFPDDGPSPAVVVAMSGTQLAPTATGEAGFIPTPNGWAINLDVIDLPPAPEGTFYEGWVNNGTDAVAVGTFHMRGDKPTPVALWSGVNLREYSTLNITLQQIGGGPASSGKVYLSGTAEFADS